MRKLFFIGALSLLAMGRATTLTAQTAQTPQTTPPADTTGDAILHTWITQQKDGKWSGGKCYDYKTGNSYDVYLELKVLKNYWLVAIRKLLRHKAHSIINIFGLTIGIALLTVGYQAVRAALVNPVHILRSE